MCKLNKKNDGRRIDPCMREAIRCLNDYGIKTLACCCGHGKHPITIVIDIGEKVNKIIPLEIFSGVCLPRKKKFYIKQKDGTYIIPESVGGEL